jgi:tRNA-splicing ligase RtcB
MPRSRTRTPLVTFGPVEDPVLKQIEACQRIEDASPAVLCADNHLGYSMPIGGVVGYESHVSPSAVGYDIACGNCAVRTDVQANAINRAAVMNDIWRVLSFGMGRRTRSRSSTPSSTRSRVQPSRQRGLAKLAADQLARSAAATTTSICSKTRQTARCGLGCTSGRAVSTQDGDVGARTGGREVG